MTERAPETAERPTILLVEDEPAVRRSMQLVLQGSGFAVRSYASGAAAVADPEVGKARGLIADFRLPEGDGLSVLRALRAAGFSGRAILVTAFPTMELEANARREGFLRVLPKPLTTRMLREAMTDLSE